MGKGLAVDQCTFCTGRERTEGTPLSGYGQFCPVAKAAEVLDQRWMLLVVRELVAGSTHFNELHRGVPRMSRTLLSKRLRQLVDAGVVVRREEEGQGSRYELTEAGQELLPVIEALGEWGVRWVDSLTSEDFDPAFLIWDMQRGVDTDALPEGRTVLELIFPDIEPEVRDWWIVLEREEVDVCDHDPGFGVDVALEAPIREFVRLWRGDLGWSEALRGGAVDLHGPEPLRRQVPSWFGLSHFSDVPR